MSEYNYKLQYISPELQDLMNGVTSKRADLTRWEKIKIYFGFMQEPPRVKVKEQLLCDLLPKTKWEKLGSWKSNDNK